MTFLSLLVTSPSIILQNSGPLIGTAKQQGAQIGHMFLERFQSHLKHTREHFQEPLAGVHRPFTSMTSV